MGIEITPSVSINVTDELKEAMKEFMKQAYATHQHQPLYGSSSSSTGDYWYKWNNSSGTADPAAEYAYTVKYKYGEPDHAAIGNPHLVKLHDDVQVVVLPSPTGPSREIGIRIAFADELFEHYKGCTGKAADALLHSVREELMKLLIEWHKEFAEGV